MRKNRISQRVMKKEALLSILTLRIRLTVKSKGTESVVSLLKSRSASEEGIALPLMRTKIIIRRKSLPPSRLQIITGFLLTKWDSFVNGKTAPLKKYICLVFLRTFIKLFVFQCNNWKDNKYMFGCSSQQQTVDLKME